MSKIQNPWYILAQLFAVLSGGLFVAGGIYASFTTNFLFLQQEIIKISLDLSKVNYTDKLSPDISKEIADGVTNSYDLHRAFIGGGLILMLLSFSAFTVGFYYRKEYR